MEAFYSDISDHISKIWDSLEEYKEIIESLSATYDSLSTHRLNQVIKTLTIISVMLLPLTLISGLYGMNVDLPHFGFGGVAMFWVLMAIMVAIVVAMIVFFHRKGWI